MRYHMKFETQTSEQSQAIIDRHKAVMFPAIAPYYGEHPIVVERAKDQYLWDIEGNRYLDFFGGVLTVSVGHANDEINERVMQQLQLAQHTSTLYINEIMVKVAEKVVQLAQWRSAKCYFTSSGTEANETAIMAARMYTGNDVIVALRHAYSGRTMTAMSVTAHNTWRLGNVTDPSIRHVRNPYVYRAPLNSAARRKWWNCVCVTSKKRFRLSRGGELPLSWQNRYKVWAGSLFPLLSISSVFAPGQGSWRGVHRRRSANRLGTSPVISGLALSNGG
jgi:4-aminobutyrate aminotransferase-like enzyme